MDYEYIRVKRKLNIVELLGIVNHIPFFQVVSNNIIRTKKYKILVSQTIHLWWLINAKQRDRRGSKTKYSTLVYEDKTITFIFCSRGQNFLQILYLLQIIYDMSLILEVFSFSKLNKSVCGIYRRFVQFAGSLVCLADNFLFVCSFHVLV